MQARRALSTGCENNARTGSRHGREGAKSITGRSLTARRARSAERQLDHDLRAALGGFLTGTSRCAEAHPRRHCSAVGHAEGRHECAARRQGNGEARGAAGASRGRGGAHLGAPWKATSQSMFRRPRDCFSSPRDLRISFRLARNHRNLPLSPLTHCTFNPEQEGRN